MSLSSTPLHRDITRRSKVRTLDGLHLDVELGMYGKPRIYTLIWQDGRMWLGIMNLGREVVWSKRNGWNNVSSRVKGWKEVIKVVGKSSMFTSPIAYNELMGSVNNGGLNMAGNFEMPSIDIEPTGSAPALSFDLNAGTVPGGEVDEEPWVYHRAGRSNLLDDDDIWALPAADAPALASSSNTSGVFCKDQVLPLTFHVFNSQEHRSTVQTITVSSDTFTKADEQRLGGGVLTALEQATFIIAPIRGSRIVEDPEMQDLVRDIDMGRAVLSVEWVEQCIDEDTLVPIDSYRVTLPGVEIVTEELNELHEEESSPPLILSRLPSPSPPPVKPDISSFFTPAPEPEAMVIRRKPRKPVTARAPTRSPKPMLPTPRSSPAPPAPRARESSSPEIINLPGPSTFRKPIIIAEKRKRQIIDLTLSDDDEEEGVEQILPEQTPLPPSPPQKEATSTAKKLAKGPRWASEEDPVDVSPRRRGPTPPVFRLTPSASRRRDNSTAL
jgi:hypothetical protein